MLCRTSSLRRAPGLGLWESVHFGLAVLPQHLGIEATRGRRGWSLHSVKLARDVSWLKDWRVIVFGVGCALAGFLLVLI